MCIRTVWIIEILFSLELQKQTLTSFNAPKTGLSVLSLKRLDHVSPYRAELHWLPVKERVNFKLLTIIYQYVHGLAPTYLQYDIQLYSSSNTRHRLLRSSLDSTRLHIPYTNRCFGDQSFHAAGPRMWNKLPQHIREASTLTRGVFHKGLRLVVRRVYCSQNPRTVRK